MSWDDYISKVRMPEFDPITVSEVQDAFDFQQARIDTLIAEKSKLLSENNDKLKRKLLDTIIELFGDDIFITTRVVPETPDDYELCRDNEAVIEAFLSEILTKL